MADTKCKPGQRKKGGRAKGTPNKLTVKVKDAILHAFDEVGGSNYLVRVAKDDPKTFCTLLSRILPNEMKHEVQTEGPCETTEEIIEKVKALRKEAQRLGFQI